MAENDAQMEKIRKRLERLMALAQHENTPQAERELAQEQLEKLMARYSIDEAITVSDATTRRDIYTMEVNLGEGETYLAQRHTLLNVIAKSLGCRYVEIPDVGAPTYDRQGRWTGNFRQVTSPKGHLFGLYDSIILAWDLYLSLNFQMELNRGQRANSAARSQRSYMLGFIASLGSRLHKHYADAMKELEPEQAHKAELVLLDDQERINLKIQEKVGEIEQGKLQNHLTDPRAYNNGVEDAQNADITGMNRKVGQDDKEAISA